MCRMVNEQDIKYFKKIISPERVLICKQIKDNYLSVSFGEVPRYPDVLLEIMTAKELSSVLGYAYKNDISVFTQGTTNTSFGGVDVPDYGRVMISLERKINEAREFYSLA